MGTKSKSITLVIVALFLASIVTLPPANSQSQFPQITISADGSIIGTDKIHQRGNTYTLTGNLNAAIIIKKDNIVLDGAGFMLEGISNLAEDRAGISLNGTTKVIIENLIISNFTIGLEAYNSSNCVITENRIFGNTTNGIYVDHSSNFWIKQNTIEQTIFYGINLYFSTRNLVSDNKVENNLGTGIKIGGNGGNNIVSGNTLKNNMLRTGGYGDIGIESSNNTIIGNSIANSSGIQLYSSNNTVTKNNISNSDAAIFFAGSNNTYFENNITNNDAAVMCWDIELSNVFYYNNFINNSEVVAQAPFYSNPSSPSWDNGTFGNYYGDYLTQNPNAKKVDITGTYDTPYTITEHLNYHTYHERQFYDNHPLIDPVEISQIPAVVPSWVTPSNQTIPILYIVIIVAIVLLSVLPVSLLL
jgi:parallel beta-helix repeat protein